MVIVNHHRVRNAEEITAYLIIEHFTAQSLRSSNPIRKINNPNVSIESSEFLIAQLRIPTRCAETLKYKGCRANIILLLAHSLIHENNTVSVELGLHSGIATLFAIQFGGVCN